MPPAEGACYVASLKPWSLWLSLYVTQIDQAMYGELLNGAWRIDGVAIYVHQWKYCSALYSNTCVISTYLSWTINIGVYSVPELWVRYCGPQHKCINTWIKLIVVRYCGPQHKCINACIHLIEVSYCVLS